MEVKRMKRQITFYGGTKDSTTEEVFIRQSGIDGIWYFYDGVDYYEIIADMAFLVRKYCDSVLYEHDYGMPTEDDEGLWI